MLITPSLTSLCTCTEINTSVPAGGCVSVSHPPAEVCLTDLAWDYPGAWVQVKCLHSFIHRLHILQRSARWSSTAQSSGPGLQQNSLPFGLAAWRALTEILDPSSLDPGVQREEFQRQAVLLTRPSLAAGALLCTFVLLLLLL